MNSFWQIEPWYTSDNVSYLKNPPDRSWQVLKWTIKCFIKLQMMTNKPKYMKVYPSLGTREKGTINQNGEMDPICKSQKRWP